MIWLWLFLRDRHTWTTGPYPWYFDFACESCGGHIAALVWAHGIASGSSLHEAQGKSYTAAIANANGASAAAACPLCGRHRPHFIAQFEAVARRVERRRQRMLPVAGAAAALVALALAFPAIRDLRHSFGLALVAMFGALAVGGFVIGLFMVPVATPRRSPNGVWFSHDPSAGTDSWFPARSGEVPAVPRRTNVPSLLAFAAAMVAGIVAAVGVFVWVQTYRHVYVVNAGGGGETQLVRVDGVEVGRVEALTNTASDVPYLSITVRTSSSHQLVVIDADGRETPYAIDPTTSRDGWVVAPRGRERGLCLAAMTTYYGMNPTDDDDALLNGKSDFVTLDRKFDVLFEPAPKTIETRQPGGEKRTSLRALACDALRDGKILPYKNAVPKVAPASPML